MSTVTLSNNNMISTLPVTIIEGTGMESKILVTSNALPKCAICFNLPHNPVTICNKKLPITNRHLMCMECASRYTENTCPVCRGYPDNQTEAEENLASTPKFIADMEALEFIKSITDSSLFICPKNCNTLLKKEAINHHVITCSNDEKHQLEKKMCSLCDENIDADDFKEHRAICSQIVKAIFRKDCTLATFLLFITQEIFDRYEQESKNKDYNTWMESKIFNLCAQKNKSLDLQVKAYEILQSLVTVNQYQCSESNLKITLNAEGKLELETQVIRCIEDIENQKITSDHNIPSRLTIKPDVHNYIANKKIIYSIAIYPYLEDSIPYACIHDFMLSEINTLQSMYKHNKNSAPKSYVNLIDFFTKDGFSKKYIDLYGEDINWKIRVAETTYDSSSND